MKKEALFYTNVDEQIKCGLCPHECLISKDKYGICGVRKNENGYLISENYGVVSALGMDPIEKKPLYHFYPGTEILSIGSLGCNMKCVFCQNCEISQTTVSDFSFSHYHEAEEIVEKTYTTRNNIGIAFTYNEPSIYFEYMLDIAKSAKEKDLKTVMVSNGFLNEGAMEMLLPFIDAFNVDIKAFNEVFYRRYTKSSLKPILERLVQIKSMSKHLEITNLVIPTLNESENEFEQMVTWISQNLGRDTVLHISKYFPRYKLDIDSTSLDLLLNLHAIAKNELHHVYLGNVALNEGRDTFCYNCGSRVISRSGYHTNIVGLSHKGNCTNCNEFLIKHI